jgi:L-seryl-tRNA(Ser) seleniumtransferase
VTTAIVETTDLSNRTPTLNIQWDRQRIGISGAAVASQLMETEPRIATPGGRDQGDQGGISVTPYMMAPGDEKVIADKISAVLAGAPKPQPAKPPAPPAADLTGQWDVQIDYVASSSQHAFYLKQTGNRLEGSHQGNFVSRDVSGTIDGPGVLISSAYSAHGDSLNFRFAGTIAGAALSGTLDMGEYLQAKWRATRHDYRRT